MSADQKSVPSEQDSKQNFAEDERVSRASKALESRPENDTQSQKTGDRKKEEGKRHNQSAKFVEDLSKSTEEEFSDSMPFTTAETMCLLDTYRKYADLLANTSNIAVKQKIWTRIVNSVNSVVSGEKNRTLSEVKRKWRQLLHQAREDFRKFKNATDENEELPEIGVYSESIWDICGSQLDLSDDSDFNKRYAVSSDDETEDAFRGLPYRRFSDHKKAKQERDDSYFEQERNVRDKEVGSDEEAAVVKTKKKSRRVLNQRRFRGYPGEINVEDSDSDDFEETGDDPEAANWQLSLMKSKLCKSDRERKKLIKEIEKLDVEKEKLSLKRQKIELEIIALRERLNKSE